MFYEKVRLYLKFSSLYVVGTTLAISLIVPFTNEKYTFLENIYITNNTGLIFDPTYLCVF